MKASKIILALFIAQILCLFIPQIIFGQTETFDIVQYTPPKGWTKTPKDGSITFSDNNKTTNGFCLITVYASTASEGNPQKDFTNRWNDLAVKLLKAEANPKTETQSADGWTITAGVSQIDVDGTKSFALLTVFSGFGKTVSVLAVFNDESYMTQLGTFTAGIELNKTAQTTKPLVSNPPTSNQRNQTGKFGSMTYAAPAGWTEQIFEDGVVFKPKDLPAEEHLTVQIMPPINFSGTLEQALAQSYDEAAAMYKVTKMNDVNGGNYPKIEAKKSFRGWDYIRGKGGVQAENGTPYKTELGLELFVVKINNRFERIAILESKNNCNPSQYYPSDRMSYRKGIENFLFSLQFTDFNATVLETGSAKGSGIVGVWQGISLSVGPTSVSQYLGIGNKVFSAIFFTNGQVYFGPSFPAEGLDGLNSRMPPELNRRDWATYTFSNGRGVLKMPYGDIPMRMENNKFIITPGKTDHEFIKMNPVDGAVFNGTYALSESNGKIPSITFTSNGRFTDHGALKVLYHEYVDCLNPAATEGSGTYEVKDYSMIFNYSDGRKIKIAFIGLEYDKSNQSPPTFMISNNYDELTKK
ncbi:MAG: hypothetical protein M3033_14980 [Acidobacteriota bacterium]|nr:hypothetical protein [Acidobacteriota bacterium]